MGHYDAKLLSSLLKSPLHDLRREAVRSLTSFSLQPVQIAGELKELIEDNNPMIRSQVIRTLTEIGVADHTTIDILVRACKPDLAGTTMGGAYERKFERYLALKALEQYPGELEAYLHTPAAGMVPVIHLLWAIQALPVGQKEIAFLKLWPQSNITTLDEPTFIGITSMLGNKQVYETVKPLIQNPLNAVAYLKYALQNQARVQSAELSVLLQVPVSNMLQSSSAANIDLALDAIGRFKMEHSRDAVVALIHEQTPVSTLEFALKALENNPKANQEIFAMVAENSKFNFELRAAALHALSKADPVAALQAFQKWTPELDKSRKGNAASILSTSNQGISLLLEVYERKLLDLSAFDLSAAERIHNANRNEPRGLAILEGVIKGEEEKKKAFKSKLSRYIAIAEKREGSPIKGEVLFQTCLMCHKVGSKGQNIAPSLDGSAARENEALLTAILDPDAALESNYAVYRVVKKDGSSMEGYLVKRDDLGTTIAFMGGSQIYIEAEAIKSQGFLGGRSFMMKGLIDNYTDSQVADLLAYIRTLN
jgi:putative heme-binding domain-containing protein